MTRISVAVGAVLLMAGIFQEAVGSVSLETAAASVALVGAIMAIDLVFDLPEIQERRDT